MPAEKGKPQPQNKKAASSAQERKLVGKTRDAQTIKRPPLKLRAKPRPPHEEAEEHRALQAELKRAFAERQRRKEQP